MLTKVQAALLALCVIAIVTAVYLSRKAQGPSEQAKYQKLGQGFCRRGCMNAAIVEGKPGQTYRTVAPFNQSLTACQELCDANPDCKFMAYDAKDKFCAMYNKDADGCSDRLFSNRVSGNHVSYKKI